MDNLVIQDKIRMATPYGLQARNYARKLDLSNTGSITLATNILSKPLYTDVWPFAQWNLYFVAVGSGTLSLIRTQSVTGTSGTENLFNGAAATANAVMHDYFFVSQGEAINFQYSVTSVITKMLIQEVLAPI